MKPELILRSDLLDILFEHRNKAYGAYDLRRHYNGHLMAGIGGMCIFTVSDPIQLSKAPDFIPPPLPPKPPSTPRQHIASVKSANFMIDPHVARIEVPDQSPDDQNGIDTKTQAGIPGNGEPSGPANSISQSAPAAPVKPPMEEEPEVLISPAVMPQFPGGVAALHRWLSSQLRPGDDQQPGQKVKVIVRFVVNRTGEIDRIELVQPGGEPYDNEVLRVIRKMPRWQAGRQNGQNVAVWFTIPIIFEMTEQ